MEDTNPPTTVKPNFVRNGRWAEYRAAALQGKSSGMIAKEYGVARTSVKEALRVLKGVRPNKALFDKDGRLIPCFYCGLDSQSLDSMTTRGKKVKRPVCKECKALAIRSRCIFERDRKQYVKRRLAEIYRKELDIAEWSEAQIEKMQPEVREYFLAARETKECVEARLAW